MRLLRSRMTEKEYQMLKLRAKMNIRFKRSLREQYIESWGGSLRDYCSDCKEEEEVIFYKMKEEDNDVDER